MVPTSAARSPPSPTRDETPTDRGRKEGKAKKEYLSFSLSRASKLGKRPIPFFLSFSRAARTRIETKQVPPASWVTRFLANQPVSSTLLIAGIIITPVKKLACSLLNFLRISSYRYFRPARTLFQLHASINSINFKYRFTYVYVYIARYTWSRFFPSITQFSFYF